MSSHRRGTGDGARTGGTVSGEPSTRIALRLAEREGVAVEELVPLAESIDPESLNGLFSPGSGPSSLITFTHEGYEITVTGDERILIDPIE